MQEIGFSNDRIVIDAGDGADRIDASGLTVDLVDDLRLLGGADADHLIGTRFTEMIDGGLGDDTVTGGPGVDVFADAGGNDTLVEVRDLDLGLYGNYYLAGTLQSGGHDSWLGGTEVESLLDDGVPIFETVRLTGGASENVLVVNDDNVDDDDLVQVVGRSPLIVTPSVADVFLDGQGGTDVYFVNVAGGNADSEIDVHDSGGANDGIDELTINATNAADYFLLREHFIARVDGSYDAESGFSHRSPNTERVNYDESLNARVRINALDGNDRFYIDDNSAILTIDGGLGDDFFQVGQVFKSERDADAITDPRDRFDTLETTRGWLSRGVSVPATIYGGVGNDIFQVYHNTAALRLEGDDGDDSFVIRAFVVLNDAAKQAMTQINSGAGADNIQYALNAPVSIDGGDGFDTVVVIGTEFHDNFVIQKDGVFGAGLNVSFTTIERLEVDGMEGDDHFFVLSTSEDIVTELIGGLGSDTFDIAGDVTGTIVSDDGQGLTGRISHSATSTDPRYDDLPVEDIILRAGDSGTPQVIVAHSSDGRTEVTEGGADNTDTYSVSLSAKPLLAVYVTVSAPASRLAVGSVTGSTVNVSSGQKPKRRAVVLVFTDANYNVPQTVTVTAIDDYRLRAERRNRDQSQRHQR